MTINYTEGRTDIGTPSITELIKILEDAKKILGDVKVVGAYDGDWSCNISIMYFEDCIIIGTIS